MSIVVPHGTSSCQHDDSMPVDRPHLLAYEGLESFLVPHMGCHGRALSSTRCFLFFFFFCHCSLSAAFFPPIEGHH